MAGVWPISDHDQPARYCMARRELTAAGNTLEY